MKHTSMLTMTGLLIALTAGTANAGFTHDRWGHGYYDGYRHGELTRSERRTLRRMERRIKRLRYRFLDDGYLSKRERRILRKKRAQYKRAKHHFTHNNRYPYYSYRDDQYWF